MSPTRLLRLAAMLTMHPSLWVTALGQYRRLVPTGWYRRRPFLPVPDRGYVRFRMQTAYGDPDSLPSGPELVDYLRWCRSWNRRQADGARRNRPLPARSAD